MRGGVSLDKIIAGLHRRPTTIQSHIHPHRKFTCFPTACLSRVSGENRIETQEEHANPAKQRSYCEAIVLVIYLLIYLFEKQYEDRGTHGFAYLYY